MAIPEQPTYLDLQARIGITKHTGGYPATDRLLELCRVREGSEVLYVGTGIGVGPAHLASTRRCRVVAVDISECVRVTRPGGWVGMNETVWRADPPDVDRAMASDSALGTILVTQAQWHGLWEASGLVDQVHEWHDLDIAEETRSRLAWIGWRWMLPAWGRALKLVVTDPASRRALRAQVTYPASLATEMGYVLSAGRRP